MSRVTFVVAYEDGKEPTISAGMEILGGKLIGVAWRDGLFQSSAPDDDGDLARLAESNGASVNWHHSMPDAELEITFWTPSDLRDFIQSLC